MEYKNKFRKVTGTRVFFLTVDWNMRLGLMVGLIIGGVLGIY